MTNAIRAERLCGRIEGPFAVFLIGLRFNRWWAVHKWLPVMRAMSPMLAELQSHPELGFLSSQMWFGRSTLMVQYWRSAEHLIRYATAADAAHLPAWRDFNRRIGKDGSVGIFHETYIVRADQYETMYVNMPLFGLAKAGNCVPAVGALSRAAGRLETPYRGT